MWLSWFCIASALLSLVQMSLFRREAGEFFTGSGQPNPSVIKAQGRQ